MPSNGTLQIRKVGFMVHHQPIRVAVIGLPLLATCLSFPAHAKPARCSTTDDGSYNCDFQPDGRDGSFTVSAPGKPTYTLTVTEPGVAFGSVSLPGRYLRSRSEPGCWVNDSTGAKLCAR